jgi:hypothetical protein
VPLGKDDRAACKMCGVSFPPSPPFVRLGRSPRPDGSRRRRRRFSASTSVQYPRRVRRGPYGTTLVRCPLSQSARPPGRACSTTSRSLFTRRDTEAFVEKREVHSVPAPPGHVGLLFYSNPEETFPPRHELVAWHRRALPEEKRREGSANSLRNSHSPSLASPPSELSLCPVAGLQRRAPYNSQVSCLSRELLPDPAHHGLDEIPVRRRLECEVVN